LATFSAAHAVADPFMVEAQARKAPGGEVARERHAHAIRTDVVDASRVEDQDRRSVGAVRRAAENPEEMLVAAEAAELLLDHRRDAAFAAEGEGHGVAEERARHG